jgi:hypothetical protein
MDSLESVMAGINAGADVIEMDVRVLPNGEAVLSHNPPEPPVQARLVRLRQVLETVKPYEQVKLNLDMKHTDEIGVVANLLHESGMAGRAFYTGIEQRNLMDVMVKGGEISYMFNYEPDPYEDSCLDNFSELVNLVKKSGAFGINLHYLCVTKEMVDALHRAHKSVSVWTVNGAFEISRMIHIGVDSITTLQPDILKAILDNPEGLFS